MCPLNAASDKSFEKETKKPRPSGLFFQNLIMAQESTNNNHFKWLLAFIWGCLLLAPNMVWILVADNPLDAFMLGLAPGIATLAFVVSWFPNLRWLIRITLPFQAMMPAEFYYVVLYHQPSSALVFGIIGESNLREAIEYLGSTTLVVLTFAGIILIAIGWWLSYFYERLPISRQLIWLRLASLLPVVLIAFLEIDWHMSYSKAFALPNSSNRDTRLATTLPSPTEAMLINTFPIGLPFRMMEYLDERKAIRSVVTDIQRLHVSAIRHITPTPPEVYVLVIGESAVSTHWHLNGYKRNTNPWLSKRTDVISLNNVISSWPATRLAVPVIITGKQESDGRAPLVAPSIIQVFRAAGFKTFWISNQMPLGLHDSVIAIHAHSADVSLFTNPGNLHSITPTDDVLLSPFLKYLKDDSPRKFFVIHLIGSHKDYSLRYPNDFSYFGTKEKQNTIDKYDNSIRFTDYLLNSIIESIQSIPYVRAALLYVSDHGETVPDSTCPSSGHGYGNANDYRVATMLWISKRLGKERPEIMQILHERASSPFVSSHAAVTLADLADISFTDWNHRNSWLHPDWTPSPRWTNVASDFDKATHKDSCGRLY